MRALKAGVIYFLLVFTVGWVIGPIRELWAVPHSGRMAATQSEAVIMLIAMTVAAEWIIRRFEMPQTLDRIIGLQCCEVIVESVAARVATPAGTRPSFQTRRCCRGGPATRASCRLSGSFGAGAAGHLVGDVEPALGKQFLYIAVAEREAQVEPHSMLDDNRRKAVARV